jgi:hypothetical protein
LLSALPLPVHVPVHWEAPLTHFPLGQSLSATHRQDVLPALTFGAGDSVVLHA